MQVGIVFLLLLLLLPIFYICFVLCLSSQSVKSNGNEWLCVLSEVPMISMNWMLYIYTFNGFPFAHSIVTLILPKIMLEINMICFIRS